MRTRVMRSRRRRWLGFLLGIGAAALLATPLLTPAAMAQGAAAPGPKGGIYQVAAATVRTLADMKTFDKTNPHPPVAMPPFLPTMDFQQYLGLKAAAAAHSPAGKPGMPGDALQVAQQGPPAQGPVSCNGIGQLAPLAQGFFPPDTHGAVGLTQFVQVVNSAIKMYDKVPLPNCPTVLFTSTLNGFFGYAAQALFDPRVVYDHTYNRWIVSAEAFPESSTVQFHVVAVSLSFDATGPYFIYFFNMRGILGANVFWDFPQLGYDEEAVLLTGNLFNPGYVGSEVFFLPKHRMYAGLGFSFCGFGLGTGGTIAPPIVLDQGPFTVLAISILGAPGKIRLSKWTGTAQVCPTFVGGVDINDAQTIAVPPSAPQPGTAQVLDTSDARFVNASTQLGIPAFGSNVELWQTRTTGSGPFAIPIFYRIDASANTIVEQCFFFASATSQDFNASIATNFAKTAFITYSSTDPPAGINAQVRFTGKKVGDACGATLIPGTANNTSANPLTGNFDPNFGAQRWGDYSAVTLDPSDTTKAWAVNEKVQTSAPPTTWKSRFFNMSNP